MGGGDGAVDVDVGFAQEAAGLLLPDFLANGVDAVLEGADVGLGKATGEVAGGGGAGGALGTQAVEVAFVLAQPLHVFESLAAGKAVVGDVEDVVTLVVGQMDFEQLQVLVDLLGQAQALDHEMDGADAPAVFGLGSGGHLIVDVGGIQHGIGLVGPVAGFEAAFDSGLAVAEDLGAGWLHSKRLFRHGWV